MRRRSPSYSPPRRGYRSPPRGRFGRHRDPPCGLLVRNIPKDSRPEEIRIQFERYGRIRDVYLPKDFHTGEPRGFGFVQFLDPYDAAEAKVQMDRQIFKGREISVVFAEENRKRPEEMRVKERSRGRMSYGGYRRSPYRGRSMSRSPRSRSRSPRSGRHSRSYNTSSRRHRHASYSPSPYRSSRSRSPSPDARRRGRESSSVDRSRSRSPKNGRGSHRKGRRRSDSPARSSSPHSNGRAKSLSDERGDTRSHSRSSESDRHSKSPRKSSRSRSKSRRESRSPRSSSLSHHKHSSSPRHLDSRHTPEPVKKTSSLLPEIRNGEAQSHGKLQ
ncbi:hypothetical protein GOP47_0016543 [Adiantum capillus-veneris]|uniref:RRM domain-containing protein n=1 Tax=Adiantum capillus-veneris TaxID=13818 RepID=A0A9D4ZAD9_ADICA|nr:hypothetical protein GOP47_0016543 [Adiantum capillus-veneris]